MKQQFIEINKSTHLYVGDALYWLKKMPSNSVDCLVTSPPYWQLRDYGASGQIGQETTPQAFINSLIKIFDEVKRVLKDTGTCWVNIGDTYSTNSRSMGLTDKNRKQKHRGQNDMLDFKQKKELDLQDKTLVGIPAMFQVAMTAQGWILRNEIIWHKPNALPASVTDRFTNDFEKVFFFVKKPKGYYFSQQLEPYTQPLNKWSGNNESYRPNPNGRNMRTVWDIPVSQFKGNHFATFPEQLVQRCLDAGCPPKGIVIDPFAGAGTTALVAKKNGLASISIEISHIFAKTIKQRLS